MGLLELLLPDPPQREQQLPAVYDGPSHDITKRQLGAGRGSEELVHSTNLDRLAIRATEIKATEAIESYGRLEVDAAREFRDAVGELLYIQEDAPDELTRTLQRRYNRHVVERLANAYDKDLRIAASRQADLIGRPVDRND